MPGNFKHRVQSTTRNAGTTAGFMNDFLHFSDGPGLFKATPSAGYAFVTCIINTAPGSGSIILTCGNDIIAEISSSASATFEHKYNSYMYASLFISIPDSTTDVTLVVSKGFGGTA